jgi:hypothetical protein
MHARGLGDVAQPAAAREAARIDAQGDVADPLHLAVGRCLRRHHRTAKVGVAIELERHGGREHMSSSDVMTATGEAVLTAIISTDDGEH